MSRRSAKARASARRAVRTSGSTSPIRKSIASLFERDREVDGIICTGGAARFKPWDQLTDEDWTFSLANKLLGQVNVVRYGAKNVRAGGAITLTTGLASQYPAPGSAIITTVNAAVDAFVRAAAVEPSISIRVNAVSPGWVAETLKAIGRNPADGIPAAEVGAIIARQFRDGAIGLCGPGGGQGLTAAESGNCHAPSRPPARPRFDRWRSFA